MQEPTAETGSYFKEDWLIPILDLPPRGVLNVRGASGYAVTSDGGDYTGGSTSSPTFIIWRIEEMARGRPRLAPLSTGQLRAATGCRLMKSRGCGSVSQSHGHHHPARRVPTPHPSRGRKMSSEDEKRTQATPEWHMARAKSLLKNGFTKVAEEHEQIAQAIERRRQQAQTK
jgi:hypothetical protein